MYQNNLDEQKLEKANRVVNWRKVLTIEKILEIKNDISTDLICDADLFLLGERRIIDYFFGKNKDLKERLKKDF